MFNDRLDLDKGLESKSIESLPLSIFLLEIFFFFCLKYIYKAYVIRMLQLLIIYIGNVQKMFLIY